MSTSSSYFKFSWLVWTFLGFFIFALVAYVTAQNVLGYNDYDTKRVAERVANLAKLRAEDEKALNSLTWIDKEKKIISIPLEEALPETVLSLQAKPLRSAGPLPGSMPSPAPMTNAPPAKPTAAPASAAPQTNAAPAAPKM